MDDPGPLFADMQSLGRVGFESGSDIYESARPGYPDDAVAHLASTLGIGEGERVLDVAAGTGKMTRQLVDRGLDCVAVEPSASMREVFGRMVPGAHCIAGTAEAIPLMERSVDAVVVAQAFHWFDPSSALEEIARVLRPGGGLALIWNERDEEDPLIAELVRISKWDVFQPYPAGRDYGIEVSASGRFGPVSRTKFRFTQFLDRSTFVAQVASRSYVRVLGDKERGDLLGRVTEFAEAQQEPIAMAYITDLFCARVAG